jgi:lysozyme
MAINRKVLDLSHYNSISSWKKILGAGIVGIIHKATEGLSYRDPRYLARRQAALNIGLVWGAYHFANASDPIAQMDNFVSVTGVDDDTLYALDWEDDPSDGTMGIEQAQQFIADLESKIGAGRCLIYSGQGSAWRHAE